MNYEAGRIDGGETLALAPQDHPSLDQPGRGRRRLLIVAAVAVVALLIGWYVYARAHKPAPPKVAVEQAPSVTVISPGRQTIDRQVSATGTLAARREMPVGIAGEGGLITRVLVEPGQWVGAGQVLATVDRSVQTQTAAGLAAQIAVARSDQMIAQAELDRGKALVDRGFISKADLQRRGATVDASAARVKAAQAALAEARARNGRLDIRSPAAGLVLTRSVDPGQIVSSGSGVLFRVAGGGQMELRAAVSESDLVGLRPGARASVTPVGSTKSFIGEIWQVSPVVDPATRQGTARIALRYDPALRPGGFASATIGGGSGFAPLLPESAVQSDRQGNFVYIVDADGRAQRRAITVGQVTDAGVSVAAGLTGSERVVQSAGAFLTPGQKVKPVLQSSQG
ncbi:MAG TPA: efflux RND transporter periplasmic adaptor subunit [Sphingomonas sp.]|jgi:RND family efflux transporter MFP subunit|nr:efflux RND transporter periplasmic adaptor subunit [Sphingomonas sp.]